jgi:hypothetical protein
MRIGPYKTLLMLLAVTTLAGCETPPFCDALTKCGGDFLANKSDLGSPAKSSEWVATSNDACIDQVPNPPSPPSASLVPPRPAGVRAIEPSTLDWCAGLITSNDGTIKFDDGWFETLKKFNGWFPSVPLYTAQIELMDNFQYSLTTVQLASQHYELTQTCLVAQGLNISCDDLNTRMKASVENTLGSVDALKVPKGSPPRAVVYGNSCVANTGGGCNCDYNVSLTTTTTGPWSSENGELNFFDAQAGPPVRADYCVNGSEFTLSGAKATDLFNRMSLKTLKLHPPTCDDQVQSKTLGETGIDCGGQCNKPCPQ